VLVGVVEHLLLEAMERVPSEETAVMEPHQPFLAHLLLMPEAAEVRLLVEPQVQEVLVVAALVG
jgi:hypothetical protein